MAVIDELKRIIEAQASGEGAISLTGTESVTVRLDRIDRSLISARKATSELFRDLRTHAGENPRRFKEFERQVGSLLNDIEKTISTIHQLQRKYIE